ncbi:cytochrome P450 CYP51F1 [Ramicandelaber brevisporus]|nr:cytochrome P450 CYP51F1 [Ramicandelaber brevisporus]
MAVLGVLLARLQQSAQPLLAEFLSAPLYYSGLSVAVLIISALLWAQIEQRLLPRDPSQPPMVPYLLPFFGSMVSFGTRPIEFFRENREKYGDCYTFLMFGRKMTACLGVDGNNFVLNSKLSHVNAEEAYRSLTVPVFGKDVVYDVPNHKLMDQKRFVKNALTHDAFRSYVPMIVEETVNYVKRWTAKSGEIDIFQAMAELIIMTASRTLQGEEVRNLLDERVADLYHDLDGGFQPINFLFEWLPLPSYYKRDSAHVNMRNLFLGIINERRAKGDVETADVVSTLMQSTYKDGTPMADHEIAHLMIAILMAGQHTSSTTTTWLLYNLANNQKLQEQLREEQRQILGDDYKNVELTFDNTRNMPLLDSVVRETLRMHPPIIEILRKVTQPIQFPGTDYVVPVGNYVMSSPYITQSDATIYKDADKFDPFRWMGSTAGLNTAVAAEPNSVNVDDGSGVDYGWGVVPNSSARSPYLPFGAGRHRCIGEQFAYVQIKTIVATLVREFDFSLTKHGFPQPSFDSMIVLPTKPTLMAYSRRHHCVCEFVRVFFLDMGSSLV